MINGSTLHDTNTAPAASADILNEVQKAWGFVPNLHRSAESPAALEAYSTLWSIAEKTSFTPQERNIVYLAIIYENECMAAWPAIRTCRAWQRSTMRRSRQSAKAARSPMQSLECASLPQKSRQRGAVSEAEVAASRPRATTIGRCSTCARACRDKTHLQLHQPSRRQDAKRPFQGKVPNGLRPAAQARRLTGPRRAFAASQLANKPRRPK